MHNSVAWGPHLQTQTLHSGLQTPTLLSVWAAAQTEVGQREEGSPVVKPLGIIESRPYLFSIWQLHELFPQVCSFPWLSPLCGPLTTGDLAEASEEAHHGSLLTVPLPVPVLYLTWPCSLVSGS